MICGPFLNFQADLYVLAGQTGAEFGMTGNPGHFDFTCPDTPRFVHYHYAVIVWPNSISIFWISFSGKEKGDSVLITRVAAKPLLIRITPVCSLSSTEEQIALMPKAQTINSLRQP